MVGKGTDACLSGKPLEVTWAPGTLLSADIITTINFNIHWSKVKPFATIREPGRLCVSRELCKVLECSLPLGGGSAWHRARVRLRSSS